MQPPAQDASQRSDDLKVAHTMLLLDIFEPDFILESRVARRDGSNVHDILYATITTQEGVPVFLYAAKALSTTDASCAEADKGLREELERVRQHTVLPEVYAISAVECSVRFYKVDKASGVVSTFVELDRPTEDAREGTGKVSREQWETDLLTPEGYWRVMAVVARVKELAMDSYLQ